MGDDRQAELDYLRVRVSELQRQLSEAEGAYGKPATPENVDTMLVEVLAELRRSGNDSLADQYAAAFERMQAAHTALENLGAGAEGQHLDAVNEATEDFERIHAAVRAWFRPSDTHGR